MAKIDALRRAIKDASHHEQVEVTPEIAREWLRVNSNNRPTGQYLVNRYRDLMEKGRWKDYVSVLFFDNKGNLIDGQHRLLALATSSNVHSVGFHVIRDADPQIVNYIDLNKNRNYRDIFTIQEGEIVSHPVASTFLRFISGSYVHTSSDLPWTREEIAELFSKYRAPLEEVCGLFGKKTKGINQACVRAAVARAWLSRPRDRERIKAYIDALLTGRYSDFDQDRAALLMREALLKGRANGTKGEMEAFKKVEQTLDSFLKKQSMHSAYAAKMEKFRLPEDDLGDLL